MKVIDLIVKISKGEEVPRKIKIGSWIYEFEWNDNTNQYWDKETTVSLDDVLSFDKEELNYEVKILEDSPKELKKLDIRQEKNIKNNWKWKIEGYCVSTPMKIIGDKVNEIIERIKNDENN